jgi:hypothetical protein
MMFKTFYNADANAVSPYDTVFNSLLTNVVMNEALDVVSWLGS